MAKVWLAEAVCPRRLPTKLAAISIEGKKNAAFVLN